MVYDSRCVRRIVTGIISLIISTSGRPSFAETKQTNEELADSTMNEVNALMNAENYADACPKLEKLISLIPDAIGAHQALGECYEKQHRIYSACIAHLKAASFATFKKDPRAEGAAELCNQYDGVIPRVLLKAPKDATNLKYWQFYIDGTKYLHINVDRFNRTHQAVLYVDQGSHKLEILYDGQRAWSHRFIIENSEVRRIDVPSLSIFGQMPGRYEATAWFLLVPSTFALIGGLFATGVSFPSRNEFNGGVAFGSSLGLITVGAAGIVGAIMLRSANRAFERSAYKSSTAHSPPPQLQFGIAPNGATLRLTF